MKDLYSEIPSIEFPQVDSRVTNSIDEDLVSLKNEGFIVSSQYWIQGIAGSLQDCYVRESLIPMLHKAESLLPDGIIFKIYDGYRPIAVQQRLWNFYRRDVINKNKGKNLTDGEIDKLTSFFVSRPSYDESSPSLHNTGGAIDLTLVNVITNNELNMGTKFDDFSNRAWTNHFEPSYSEYEQNELVMMNRRLLYNVMTAVGFTNLPSEWWHYDYGDKFWAYFNEKEPIYRGILDANLPNKYPLI